MGAICSEQPFLASTLRPVREQVASNLIGQHIQTGASDVINRVRAYGAVTTRGIDPAGALHRGQLVLASVVRSAAVTQSVMDAFIAIGFFTALALLLVVSRSAAPVGAASAIPLFTRRVDSP